MFLGGGGWGGAQQLLEWRCFNQPVHWGLNKLLPWTAISHGQHRHVFNTGIGCELLGSFSSGLFAKSSKTAETFVSWRLQDKILLPAILLLQEHSRRHVLWWWLHVPRWHLMVYYSVLRMPFCNPRGKCQRDEHERPMFSSAPILRGWMNMWAVGRWGRIWWAVPCAGSSCAKIQQGHHYCLEVATMFDFYRVLFFLYVLVTF